MGRPHEGDQGQGAGQGIDTQAAALALGTTPANVRTLGHRGALRRVPGTDGHRRALWSLDDVERLAEQRSRDARTTAV